LVRITLTITQAALAGKYAVHELLFPEDPVLGCNAEELNSNENPGRDIVCDEHGHWRSLQLADYVQVDAGFILHRG
jgi:hypothetical protein